MNTFISDLSQKEFPLSEKVNTEHLGAALLAFIRERYPYFQMTQCLAFSELSTSIQFSDCIAVSKSKEEPPPLLCKKILPKNNKKATDNVGGFLRSF